MSSARLYIVKIPGQQVQSCLALLWFAANTFVTSAECLHEIVYLYFPPGDYFFDTASFAERRVLYSIYIRRKAIYLIWYTRVVNLRHNVEGEVLPMRFTGPQQFCCVTRQFIVQHQLYSTRRAIKQDGGRHSALTNRLKTRG